MRKRWLSRHKDGRHFIVSGQKASMLPMKWQKPTNVVQKQTVTIPISRIIPRETKPGPGEFGTFEDRVQYFVNLIKDGVIPVAPILVQKRPDGRYFLVDGHARVMAYSRLGYKNVQANISKNPTLLSQITT
jgi:hypothetical protein